MVNLNNTPILWLHFDRETGFPSRALLTVNTIKAKHIIYCISSLETAICF